MKAGILLRILGIAAGLAFARPGACGIKGRIGDPLLLPTVRYKILVLEYDSPQRSNWGSDLSQIIAQETIGSIRGVQSVGVVHLTQPEKRVILGPDKVTSLV